MKKSVLILAACALVAGLAVSCTTSGAATTATKAPAAAVEAVDPGPVVAPTISTLSVKDAIHLRAPRAKITKGAGGEGVHVEAGGNVGYWSSVNDIITWEFDVAEDGDYAIVIDYAVAKEFANAKVKTTVGDATFEWFAVETASDWGKYVKIDVGTASLTAGKHSLTLQAVSIANRFVANLKSVYLVKK